MKNILNHPMVTNTEIERDEESITLNLFCDDGNAQELLDTLPIWVTRWGQPEIGNEQGSYVAIKLVHRETLAATIRVIENLIREMEPVGSLLSELKNEYPEQLNDAMTHLDLQQTDSFFYAIQKAKEIIGYESGQ